MTIELNSPLIINGQEVYPQVTPKNVKGLIDFIYPVGSIYMSVNDTNPHDLFGGTWEQINGRFLVGVGELDDNTTDYWGALTGKYNMPAGEKGGQVQHKLTIDETPAHTHDIGGSPATAPNGYDFGPWSAVTNNSSGASGGRYYGLGIKASGGNQPHNNIPPYLAVYIWKRTA